MRLISKKNLQVGFYCRVSVSIESFSVLLFISPLIEKKSREEKNQRDKSYNFLSIDFLKKSYFNFYLFERLLSEKTKGNVPYSP